MVQHFLSGVTLSDTPSPQLSLGFFIHVIRTEYMSKATQRGLKKPPMSVKTVTRQGSDVIIHRITRDNKGVTRRTKTVVVQ